MTLPIINSPLQPILENDLVFLRPLRENDYAALFEVAKDPLIWEQHPNKDRYKEEVFRVFFQDAIASGGALAIIDKASEKIIGSSRFKPVVGTESAWEIGWTFIARDYWGGIYNRSIKNLMIAHAFAFVEDVVFHIGENNLRSRRAVEKIGGKKITAREFPQLVPERENYCTYLIRKREWAL